MRQASTVRLSIHLPLLRSLSTCQLGRAEGVLASVAALTSLRKIGLSELTELNALMGVGWGGFINQSHVGRRGSSAAFCGKRSPYPGVYYLFIS